MKLEYKKHLKDDYYTKQQPRFIDIKPQQFITIEGAGNPNNPLFSEHIGALYTLAYSIKMLYRKSETLHQDYNDFTVFPLEGIWDLVDYSYFSKDNLKYTLMIRQPDFITADLFDQALQQAKIKKSNPHLDYIEFRTITDGPSVEMLHVGSFDTESETFKIMEAFEGYERASLIHREIYVSDFRRVDPSRLKTILRFSVK